MYRAGLVREAVLAQSVLQPSTSFAPSVQGASMAHTACASLAEAGRNEVLSGLFVLPGVVRIVQ